MRRALMVWILTVMIAAIFVNFPAYGQSVDKEGKAWLSSCSDPSGLNVTGVWQDAKWGNISLSQHQNSRHVVGSGDGWNVSGVVSGNSVCLLFFNGSKVAYSAKLTADASGNLAGGYVKGLLSEKSKTTSMKLVKSKG